MVTYFAREANAAFGKWMNLIEDDAKMLDEDITIDPGIMGGLPVIKGTRVPVYTVSKLVERGASLEEIKEGYPYLTEKAIEAAVLYARAHPRSGRRKKTFR